MAVGNRFAFQKELLFQKGIYLFSHFLPRAVASFSTREYEAAKDLSRFLDTFGVSPERFRSVEQVHGDKIILVDGSSPSMNEAADGLVTKERGLALGIRTADCVPLFFFDPETPAVGICHAGWRGAKKGIIFRVLDIFRDYFSSDRSSIRVALGPAICERCYEVGAEFQGYFPGFVRREGGRYFFDLGRAVRTQLLEAGIPASALPAPPFCTSCSVDQFFSARREGLETGRFLSAIMLK